ncbi:hypothetical protein VTJ04DRAFT_2583 [Mycothermus thermophilus]|uniref:uncharacterized protein n=1 Tax=Humicola insolens TaxID=85995 RepID=UPI0037429E20
MSWSLFLDGVDTGTDRDGQMSDGADEGTWRGNGRVTLEQTIAGDVSESLQSPLAFRPKIAARNQQPLLQPASGLVGPRHHTTRTTPPSVVSSSLPGPKFCLSCDSSHDIQLQFCFTPCDFPLRIAGLTWTFSAARTHPDLLLFPVALLSLPVSSSPDRSITLVCSIPLCEHVRTLIFRAIDLNLDVSHHLLQGAASHPIASTAASEPRLPMPPSLPTTTTTHFPLSS